MAGRARQFSVMQLLSKFDVGCIRPVRRYRCGINWEQPGDRAGRGVVRALGLAWMYDYPTRIICSALDC